MNNNNSFGNPSRRRRVHKKGGKRLKGKRNFNNRNPNHVDAVLGRHVELRFREFIPQSLAVRLPFESVYLLTNPSLTVSSKALRTNSVYDVDPALGSTDTQGYNRFAEDYNYYRVVKYRYRLEVYNQNNFPVMFVVISSITNLTGTTGIGTTDLTPIRNNPSAQSRVLTAGVNTYGRAVFSKTMTPEQVEGTIMARTDDHYQSLTGNSPANLTWINFSVTALDGVSTLVNNVTVSVTMYMDTLFYGRNTASS
jgi:hypothetical protein